MSRVPFRRMLVSLALLLLLAAAAFMMRGLLDQDLDRHRSEAFDFSNGDTRRAGRLWLPAGEETDKAPVAAVVLVHGDGPQDRTSDNGYAPLINSLLDAGIAVASWDKPGIGASSGDWLAQSMQERADETAAALAALRARFPGVATGALGFSQAGWVLPKLRAPQADFLVLAGPAISWIDQARYFRITSHVRDGMDRGTAERAADAQALRDKVDFGPQADEDAIRRTGLTPARHAFVRRNLHADATQDLRGLDIPLLAIWGTEDMNVDAKGDSEIYRTVLAGRADTQVVLVPNATHGLLKADVYNAQLVSEWSTARILRFLVEGRRAYAPSALDTITGFIQAHSRARADHR
ncbi:S9 family peptidase [Rhizobium sp. AQ_MP]|uniref:alpha/beta hydrolase family protein n=1 Tax=Rhizobium sp. AQ_MP TaxID=2761536 RepID=UPI001FEF5EC7|nr:alpha/beta hydrolase [Rhizobium sp. AQ_MP]